MIRYALIFLLFITLTGGAPLPKGTPVEVTYKGALRDIMHKGDLTAKADLVGFEGMEHLYALGALEGLKGEVLILAGKPYISTAQGEGLDISHSLSHKATLLVYSTVSHWIATLVPGRVSTYQQLEKYVESAARKQGLDTNKPFPFLLKGRVKSIDWHVIDWKEGDTEHSHEKHIRSGPHGTLEGQDVEILGFYSKHHHAIFTHHSTNMHLHFKTSDGRIAGHADDLLLGSEITLELPALK